MSYRDICFQIYWKLKSIIAPTLKYSQSIYEDALKSCVNSSCINDDCKWLDLGCGHHLLPPWRYEEECKLVGCKCSIVGLDYDFNSLKKHRSIQKRIRGDISFLPFGDGCFDLVTSNMVFEHLEDPMIQLREINRVLKPGGTLLFHTPNALSYGTMAGKIIPEPIKNKLAWLLQGRKPEDIFPTYYRINSIRDINRFAELSGFVVDKIKMITSTAEFVIIPPLVIFELIFIKILMKDRMKAFRTNIIAKLTKPIAVPISK
jgi:ubiquinone/menaquinone biosynthesis C-methylase UbiE